jgi:putative membrane protein insertion efficiency factor
MNAGGNNLVSGDAMNFGLAPARLKPRLQFDTAAIARGFTDDRQAGRPSLPQRALLSLITAYQRWVSPTLPVVTLGACACRFAPSCSHYAAEAVATHGVIRGTWLAICRLAKCGPWHPGGLDPVPPAAKPPLHCVAVR